MAVFNESDDPHWMIALRAREGKDLKDSGHPDDASSLGWDQHSPSEKTGLAGLFY